MYVVSLVKLKKNLLTCAKVLVVLVILGLILPKMLAIAGDYVSPASSTAWKAVSGVATRIRSGVEGVFQNVEPFIHTLKDYYRGK